MVAAFNQHHLGTLPSNTIQILRNDNHYLAITTQSAKAIIDPPMQVVDHVRNDNVYTDDVLELKLKI